MGSHKIARCKLPHVPNSQIQYRQKTSNSVGLINSFPWMSKKPTAVINPELVDAQDQFILEWGRMSSSWGINRTMAQIHALLFVSGVPLEVNEIMERLQISRGNASMNLRELMDWGIVRRFRRPGDRKDTYVSETDPYQMFIRVVRERKRREIDPTADAIKDCLRRVPGSRFDDKIYSGRGALLGQVNVGSDSLQDRT